MSKSAAWLMRVALATVYVWFGALKLVGMSPATTLVKDLFAVMLPHPPVSFAVFYVLFALFEVAIGIAFLVPKLTHVAFLATVVHVACTALPLAVLPNEAWAGFLAPTLEGQYIVKNVLILACAYALGGHHRRRRKEA